jgi:hypothetical protein
LKAWLLLIVVLAGIGQERPKQQNTSSHGDKDSNQKPVQALIVPPSPPTHPEAKEAQGCTDKNTQNGSKQLSTQEALANWALVLVGFIGIGVAVWTLLVIRRQTKATEDSVGAMRDSVELQAIGMRQWVDIDNWRTSLKESSGLLLFHFDLVNNTERKLTVEDVSLKIDERTSCSHHGNVVAPKGGRYTVGFPYVMSREEAIGYISKSVTRIFSLSGLIVYMDILGKRQEQPFTGIVSCSRDRTSFQVGWQAAEQDD